MSGLFPPERRCARPRASRLSRSFRASQPAELEPPRPVTEFQTPSRLHRCRAADSPQQDSDCQQDIVWDAASPSPRRSGNRGKKQVARGVNISEIVSRIAPKHGRPAVTEPTLQQWIGDSATIPCTPDLQAPKSRRSPRLTVVDDLLRLAKQFDLNMFRPDAVEPPLSPELLTDDPLEAADHRTDVQPAEVDELDFLFDGPTQHVSGRISQPSQDGPGAAERPLACSAWHGVGVQDDWENDHLFNDSLVLETTQNPEKFVSPIVCSTQKSLTPIGQVRLNQNPPPVKLFQSATGRVRVGRGPDHGSDLPPALRQFQPAEDKENLSPGSGAESDSGRLFKGVHADCGVSQGPDRHSGLPPPTRDVMLDDLDALFSAEPLWDDAEEDDLLCQMCEDLERQIHPDAPASNQRVAPPMPFTKFKADSSPAPCEATLHLNTAGESVGFVSAVGGSERPGRSDWVPTTSHTFKKPNNSVSVVTSTVPLRCSDAEIQMKKQQAMERRRRRLQAAGRNPTGSFG